MSMQYVGARYVIKIYENKSDPLTAQWDANTEYEPLTLVTDEYNSYLSKKFVPATIGKPALNPQYWVQTGYYSGQVMELYNISARLTESINAETEARSTKDTELSTAISNLNLKFTGEISALKNDDIAIRESIANEVSTRENADTALSTAISNEATARSTADNTLQSNITSETNARSAADALLDARIDQIVAPTGEAPSAAEVLDARVGVNGDTYNSLGDAIRGQVTDLRNLANYTGEILGTVDNVIFTPTEVGALKNDGTIDVTFSNFLTTDYIPVTADMIYKFTASDVQYSLYICAYDSNKDFISFYNAETPTLFAWKAPSTAAYVRFSVSSTVYSNGISFSLYENAINKVYDEIRGKNLVGNDPTVLYPVDLKQGDTLAISSSDGSTPTTLFLEAYDGNLTKLTEFTIYGPFRTLTLGSNADGTKYLRWSTTPSVTMQVEFGIAATPYEAYKPNIYAFRDMYEKNKRVVNDIYGKNLCGGNPNMLYPVEFETGDVITISSSDGTTPETVMLELYDGNYIKLGEYTIYSALRTITITSQFAATRYIKWSTTPSVSMQVEFGAVKTAYSDYEPNIYAFKEVVKQNNNNKYAYIGGQLPIVTIMTYNVGQWYDGTRNPMPAEYFETYKDIQQEIILKNYASIMCLQEYWYELCDGALNSKELLLTPAYKQVETLDETISTYGKAIATNLHLVSSESVDFIHQSGVAQKYQKSYAYINGHKVCICNVHLSQLSEQDALIEIREIINTVSTEEYFIVLGDFNIKFEQGSGSVVAPVVIEEFEAIGGVPCSGGAFGTFETCKTGEYWHAIDNIFVSDNMTIKSVYIDETKIDAELPLPDHVPLIANLEIL